MASLQLRTPLSPSLSSPPSHKKRLPSLSFSNSSQILSPSLSFHPPTKSPSKSHGTNKRSLSTSLDTLSIILPTSSSSPSETDKENTLPSTPLSASSPSSTSMSMSWECSNGTLESLQKEMEREIQQGVEEERRLENEENYREKLKDKNIQNHRRSVSHSTHNELHDISEKNKSHSVSKNNNIYLTSPYGPEDTKNTNAKSPKAPPPSPSDSIQKYYLSPSPTSSLLSPRVDLISHLSFPSSFSSVITQRDMTPPVSPAPSASSENFTPLSLSSKSLGNHSFSRAVSHAKEINSDNDVNNNNNEINTSQMDQNVTLRQRSSSVTKANKKFLLPCPSPSPLTPSFTTLFSSHPPPHHHRRLTIGTPTRSTAEISIQSYISSSLLPSIAAAEIQKKEKIIMEQEENLHIAGEIGSGLVGDNESLGCKIEELGREMEGMKEEMERIKRDKEEINKENQRQKVKLNEMKNEISSLQIEIHRVEYEKSQVETDLSNEIERNKMYKKQREDEHLSSIDTLRHSLHTLQSTYDTLLLAHQVSTTTIASLHGEMKDKSLEIKWFMEENLSLLSEREKMEEKMKESRKILMEECGRKEEWEREKKEELKEEMARERESMRRSIMKEIEEEKEKERERELLTASSSSSFFSNRFSFGGKSSTSSLHINTNTSGTTTSTVHTTSSSSSPTPNPTLPFTTPTKPPSSSSLTSLRLPHRTPVSLAADISSPLNNSTSSNSSEEKSSECLFENNITPSKYNEYNGMGRKEKKEEGKGINENEKDKDVNDNKRRRSNGIGEWIKDRMSMSGKKENTTNNRIEREKETKDKDISDNDKSTHHIPPKSLSFSSLPPSSSCPSPSPSTFTPSKKLTLSASKSSFYTIKSALPQAESTDNATNSHIRVASPSPSRQVGVSALSTFAGTPVKSARKVTHHSTAPIPMSSLTLTGSNGNTVENSTTSQALSSSSSSASILLMISLMKKDKDGIHNKDNDNNENTLSLPPENKKDFFLMSYLSQLTSLSSSPSSSLSYPHALDDENPSDQAEKWWAEVEKEKIPFHQYHSFISKKFQSISLPRPFPTPIVVPSSSSPSIVYTTPTKMGMVSSPSHRSLPPPPPSSRLILTPTRTDRTFSFNLSSSTLPLPLPLSHSRHSHHHHHQLPTTTSAFKSNHKPVAMEGVNTPSARKMGGNIIMKLNMNTNKKIKEREKEVQVERVVEMETDVDAEGKDKENEREKPSNDDDNQSPPKKLKIDEGIKESKETSITLPLPLPLTPSTVNIHSTSTPIKSSRFESFISFITKVPASPVTVSAIENSKRQGSGQKNKRSETPKN